MKKLTQLILFSCLLFFISCQSIPKGYHTINRTYVLTGSESCNNLMQKIKKEWAISDKIVINNLVKISFAQLNG